MSVFLFFSPAIALFIIRFLLPRTWDKVLWLGLFVAIYGLFLWFHDSREERLPFAVVAAELQVILLAISYSAAELARYVYGSLRHGRDRVSSAGSQHLSNMVFLTALGALIPGLLAIAGIFTRLPGIALFLVLGAVTIFSFLLSSRPQITSSVATFCKGFSASLVLVLVFAAYTGATISKAAELTAAGAPFCIQSGSSTAGNVLDLTFLNLRDRNGLYYHAVLAVGNTGKPRFYNWSYRAWRFLPAQEIFDPNTICKPAPAVTP